MGRRGHRKSKGNAPGRAEVGNIGAEKFSKINKSQAVLTIFVQKTKDYYVFVKIFSYHVGNRLANITNICIIFLSPSLDFSNGVVDYLTKEIQLSYRGVEDVRTAR